MNSDFRVGHWTVRPSLNTLSQNGTTARVEPKVMQVLVCLASHPNSAVTKEEILKTVWPDKFVSDDALVRSISELRRVFKDEEREPGFTAGGVVFAGDSDGNFIVLNAKTGHDLWHVQLGAAIYSTAITFDVDQKEYVVIPAGSALFAFTLRE